MLWVNCLVTGLCVAGAAWFARHAYMACVSLVACDLAARLHGFRFHPQHLNRWIHVWLLIVATVLFGIWLGGNAPVVAWLVAALLSAGPWYLVRRLSQKRRLMIEDQLADAMVTFSSAIRAGLSIPQALEFLSQECPTPIRQEFTQLVSEYRLGKPLERTLEEGKERLHSENFSLFAAALLASRQSGGRLNNTVERMSKSILEIQRLERKVMSETAQARKSAIYMAIAPVMILLLYLYIDPINTQMLFGTLVGQAILAAAVVLDLAAYIWARAILNVNI